MNSYFTFNSTFDWNKRRYLEQCIRIFVCIFLKGQLIRNIKSPRFSIRTRVKLESRCSLMTLPGNISISIYACAFLAYISWYEVKCRTVGITAKSTERSATSTPVVSRIPSVAWRHDASEAITATSRHSCFSLYIFLSVITRRGSGSRHVRLAISFTNSRNGRPSAELKSARVGEMPPTGLSDRPVIVWEKRVSPRA